MRPATAPWASATCSPTARCRAWSCASAPPAGPPSCSGTGPRPASGGIRRSEPRAPWPSTRPAPAPASSLSRWRTARTRSPPPRSRRSFLEEVHAHKVLAKRRDGEATKVRMLAVWAPLLDVPLVHLTRDKIDEVLTARKVKPATMRRIWNPFRRMLREADEREALPADLARKLLRRPEALIGLTPDEPRERWLGDRDEGEPARFEAALAVFTSGEPGGGDFLRTACALALATGMRRGEIVRLTDTMANLKERTISLPASITKGNKPRTIDLHDKAVAAITLWREVRKALKVQSVDGALFPGDPVHWERRLTAWNRDFHHLCEQAGIVDLHFHDLRHDFGVRFLHAGGTMEQLQKVLGHASIVTTAKHYGHAIPKDVRRAVLAM